MHVGLRGVLGMKQLTIRGVDAALHQALQLEAERRDTSVNRLVISLLKQSVGLANGGSRAAEYNDLDALAGTWSQADYEEFTQRLREQRMIDQELWS